MMAAAASASRRFESTTSPKESRVPERKRSTEFCESSQRSLTVEHLPKSSQVEEHRIRGSLVESGHFALLVTSEFGQRNLR